jgi:hypothetical protein
MVRKTRKNVQDPPAIAAIMGKNTAALARLLASGTSPNLRYKGETLLMVATSLGRPEIVKLLLEKGADPSKTTKTGGTALAFAVMGDVPHTTCISLLLADLRTNPSAAWTPYHQAITALHYAVSHGKKGLGGTPMYRDKYIQVIKMLLADARLDSADRAASKEKAQGDKQLMALFK